MKQNEQDACIRLLRERQAEIAGSGDSRLCQRGDFTPQQVNDIKACFGPWPRALEAAGLKEPRGGNRAELNREKRARAKRRLRENAFAANKKNEESDGKTNENKNKKI